MQNVTELRKKTARGEVVDALWGLVGRATSGELTGLLYIASINDGPDESGRVGDFAEDHAYALEAATEGFHKLIGWTAEKPGAFNVPMYLPYRLREGNP